MATILLVDDNPSILRLFASGLRRYAVEVVTAPSYAEGLLVINHYEAVGLYAVVADYDLGSGDLTGQELLRKVPLGTRRILMSGNPPSHVYDDPRIHLVLEKPFTLDVLVRALCLRKEGL